MQLPINKYVHGLTRIISYFLFYTIALLKSSFFIEFHFYTIYIYFLRILKANTFHLCTVILYSGKLLNYVKSLKISRICNIFC
jgi:hypothetical protein